MTKEEIFQYAFEPTVTPNKTKITFKNGEYILGYFKDNVKNSELVNQNKWIFFVTFPLKSDEKEGELQILNGADFVKITL